MVRIFCDICKKPIKNASKDVNYLTFQEKNFCLPCKDDLDDSVRDKLRAKGNYTFQENKKVIVDTIAKMCG